MSGEIFYTYNPSFQIVVILPIIYRAEDGGVTRAVLYHYLQWFQQSPVFLRVVARCVFYDCVYNRPNHIINTLNFESKASINPGSHD